MFIFSLALGNEQKTRKLPNMEVRRFDLGKMPWRASTAAHSPFSPLPILLLHPTDGSSTRRPSSPSSWTRRKSTIRSWKSMRSSLRLRSRSSETPATGRKRKQGRGSRRPRKTLWPSVLTPSRKSPTTTVLATQPLTAKNVTYQHSGCLPWGLRLLFLAEDHFALCRLNLFTPPIRPRRQS